MPTRRAAAGGAKQRGTALAQQESANIGGSTDQPAADIGDEALLQRLQSGDERAFVVLVDRYGRALLRLIAGYVPSSAVAEEVLQEVWIAVARGVERFEGRSKFRTWLYQIAINRAKTMGARERRTVPLSALARDDDAPLDFDRFNGEGGWIDPPHGWQTESPERIAIRSEAMAALRAALDRLPPAQRAAVTMVDIEGLDVGEACNALGVTETNFRVLQHRGRMKLRRVLEDVLETRA